MNYLVAVAFLAILGSLAAALIYMMRDGRNGEAKTSRMAKALAFRVGFSILLLSASWWPGSWAISAPLASPCSHEKANPGVGLIGSEMRQLHIQ